MIQGRPRRRRDAAGECGPTPERIREMTRLPSDFEPLEDLSGSEPRCLCEGNPAEARQQASPDPSGPDGEKTVVLIFEMCKCQYHRARPDLDRLIGRHDLICHVQLDGQE